MNYNAINTLLEYLPENNEFSNFLQSVGGSAVFTNHSELTNDSLRFILAYRDLSLGWKRARYMALNNVPFPCFLQGNDLWLFKAYLYCLDSKKFFSKAVAEALVEFI